MSHGVFMEILNSFSVFFSKRLSYPHTLFSIPQLLFLCILLGSIVANLSLHAMQTADTLENMEEDQERHSLSLPLGNREGEREEQQSNEQKLPTDIRSLIFSYFSQKDLLRMGIVSKNWRIAAKKVWA